jgi:AcrR family transcriptional regulator
MYDVARENPKPPADRFAEKAAKRAEKLSASAAKVAATADKLSETAARHVESLERLAERLDGLDLWTRDQPGRRQARFTREEIADAAVRIADAEGIDAVTMRRLAAELDAGTMTLYHYLRTKDELLALLADTVVAEVVVPDDEPLPKGWRDALTVLARRSRDALLRHPWALDIAAHESIGPNSVRHFDQTLEAVSSLDISLLARLDIVVAVDEYVFGYCVEHRGGEHVPERNRMTDYVEELVATGGYPHLAKLVDDLGADAIWAAFAAHGADDSRFDRNLGRLLDGIEASLPG